MTTDGPQSIRIRNRYCHPFILTEGVYVQEPSHPPGYPTNWPWYNCLTWYDRLAYHSTLQTARFSGKFKNLRSPVDSLDIKLTSQYDQSLELFADKEDVVLQPDTVCNVNDLAPECTLYGDNTTNIAWRRLQNTRELPRPGKVSLGHPLQKTPITERISPYSAKVMATGPHSPLTNPGYSRQPSDGSIFHY